MNLRKVMWRVSISFAQTTFGWYYSIRFLKFLIILSECNMKLLYLTLFYLLTALLVLEYEFSCLTLRRQGIQSTEMCH